MGGHAIPHGVCSARWHVERSDSPGYITSCVPAFLYGCTTRWHVERSDITSCVPAFLDGCITSVFAITAVFAHLSKVEEDKFYAPWSAIPWSAIPWSATCKCWAIPNLEAYELSISFV